MDPISTGPEIVCLLPVRNGGDGLPLWLDEAGAFSDAVVALDDGSTDETADVLRAHPLVAKVVENPRRDGYLGWHDGVNRNRLLAAAAELSPRWIISLDADERMDTTDAAALRRFVSSEALTACAYGFQVFRMVPGERYDPAFDWVFRLFRFRAGQRFPHRRVDFVPIPTSIPSTAWVRTTLRIKHYAEPDEAARRKRVAKYREADPEGNFRSYYENFRPHSAGPHAAWAPRPPEQRVLLSASPSGPATADRRAPLIVCLLPVRDGAAHLAGWFDSVSRFADAVVALDDGSSDGTADLLRAQPLVRRLLVNPRRPGFAGWDDGANRARLLEAAGELSPDWVVFLDVDERVPLEDGVALRRFVADQARPGFAYGFPLYRMIGDDHHYDRLESVAWRMFAFVPGLKLATGRLHRAPVPSDIPRHHWVATTIRIQHLGGLSQEDRQARWRKYQDADPDHEWEPDYEYTRLPTAQVVPWPPRDVDTPVVDWPAAEQSIDELELAALDLEGPALSIALLATPEIAEQMVDLARRLADQPCPEPFELLVATAHGLDWRRLVAELPNSRLVEVDVGASPGSMRNAALWAARGDYITFFDAPSPIAPGLVAALLEAHHRGHALLVGRAACEALPRPAMASVLLDIAGLPAKSDAALPGPVASFACDALTRSGGFDEHAPSGVDELVARKLLRQGFSGAHLELLAVTRPAQPSTVAALWRRRVALGRLLASAGEIAGDEARRPTGPARAVVRQYRAGHRSGRAATPAAGWRLSALLAAGSAATWVGVNHEAIERLTRQRRARRLGG